MSQLTRIAAAMAAMISVPAFAATAPVAIGTIYGGGATLPVSAYVGSKWLGTTNALTNRQAITTSDKKVLNSLYPASIDSLFGQVTLTSPVGKSFNISYCATGSSKGRAVIRGALDATGSCGQYDVSPVAIAATTPQADFAGSDAPFSVSEYNSFATAVSARPGRVAPVQFPAIAAAIAIIYNNSDLGNAKLNLTTSQLCQIYSGQISNWSQLGYAAKPIALVKRSDGSGTTFAFSNHISAACPTAFPVSVNVFATESTLNTGIPVTAIGGDGNGAVVAAVLSTDGAIGYADVADGQARAALNGGGVLRIATLSIKPDTPAYVEDIPQFQADGVTPLLKNGIRVTKAVKVKAVVYKKFDPLNAKHFPASVAVTTLADQVIGANVNGRPTMVALVDQPGATPGCVQTVDPSTYAVPALNVKGDYVQYPIVAISYLMGYNRGNALENGVETPLGLDKADALRRLFSAPYAISSKVKTIGKKKGFAGLTITAGPGSPAATGAGLVAACVLN